MEQFKNINEARSSKFFSASIAIKNAYFEFKAMKVKKYELLSELITPLIYLLCFGVGIGATVGNTIVVGNENISYIQYVVPGILCMFSVDFFSRALFRTVIDKQWGLLGYKLMQGTSPFTYIVSSLVPSYIKYVIKSLLIMFLSVVFFSYSLNIVGFIYFIIFSIFSILFWTCLGITVGLIVKNYQQRDFVMSILLSPIIFCSPIFYSVETVPSFLRFLININPLTYIINISRDLMYQMSMYQLYNDLFIIGCLLVVIIIACITLIKKSELKPIRF